MTDKELKVKKLQASMERHKAWQVYWQTKIITKEDCSPSAWAYFKSHTEFINECTDQILEIAYEWGEA